jgi:hypothetical protein
MNIMLTVAENHARTLRLKRSAKKSSSARAAWTKGPWLVEQRDIATKGIYSPI